MILLLDVALASTVVLLAACAATRCLPAASAGVRRTIWRVSFAGVAALPLLIATGASQPAAAVLSAMAIPALSSAADAAVRAPWLLMLWAAGCLAVLGRLSLGLVRVRQWSRAATPGEHGKYSSAVAVPMTWGVVRPEVLLPSDVQTWPAHARELVARHELAHIASRDWAWQTFGRLIVAFMWFNPLVWIADRQLRREAERAADDAVLMGGAEAPVYAQELINAARALAARSRPTVAAVGMVDPTGLEQRVRRILDPRVRRQPAGAGLRGLIAVLVATVSVSAAALQQAPVYRVGDEGVTPPKVVKEVRPGYTQEAMDQKVQGNVLLELVVMEDGRPAELRVVKALEPSLDRAASDAALQWRFEPARRDDQPVRVRVHLEMHFKLSDHPPS